MSRHVAARADRLHSSIPVTDREAVTVPVFKNRRHRRPPRRCQKVCLSASVRDACAAGATFVVAPLVVASVFDQHNGRVKIARASASFDTVAGTQTGYREGATSGTNHNQCRCRPGNGVTSTESFELTPPSVADMFVMNSSLPANTALALKSSALLPVPL
jgi:hypothetical protein